MTCDYCNRPAKYMSAVATNEPLCTPCAKDHYGTDWRDSVRKIGKRDVALYGLTATTTNLINQTAYMIASVTL